MAGGPHGRTRRGALPRPGGRPPGAYAPGMTVRADELIDGADLNGLLRLVGALCASGEWDELLDLADRCDDAIEQGKQLWPIAAHIEYRLALEAPGDYAAGVLVPDAGRFAVGPLTEVVAFSHSWDELADFIEAPQTAAYVAQERVLRGEDLRGDVRAHAEVLDLPLVLEPWEPTYALAAYKWDHVEVAEPWEPRVGLQERVEAPGPRVEDPELETALLDLVGPWTSESNGVAATAAVEGGAACAAAHLTLGRLRMGTLEPAEAIQRMAWAAASGGAHGRRRGAALGRWMAWSVASLAAGLEWPAAGPDLVGGLAGLRFYRWDEGGPEEGWVLRLGLEHLEDGWAAALAATDIAEEV